ncbi:MAG: GNAT family N-acetyltransferase [Flavobacteriaceae bacterium]|nr:GNAT family N-acetyltransferase [Mangrovimonas sp.]MCB0470667.1 GNAT family N-acetyltransferase [Flavobacteriaceae bacterium]HPF96691.1 GNAT family N-acetyltransferase [Mangrovimonas sp.]HRV54629.1 GNAT family N-acetyltransferase [Mangrovimonas sp.]
METLTLIRTNSTHEDFKNLVAELNAYLSVIDGSEHAFYQQYNGIENLNHVVIAYKNNEPVACGAFKRVDASSAEIKRMYTKPEVRKYGLASKVLKELEQWAFEEHFENTILETGKRQVEAVKFYQKNHYLSMPNFGPYQGIENSVCFKKTLTHEKG